MLVVGGGGGGRGTEYELTTLGSHWRPNSLNSGEILSSFKVIENIKKKLNVNQMKLFGESCFGHFLKVYDMNFSGGTAHHMLLRELESLKTDEMEFKSVNKKTKGKSRLQNASAIYGLYGFPYAFQLYVHELLHPTEVEKSVLIEATLVLLETKAMKDQQGDITCMLVDLKKLVAIMRHSHQVYIEVSNVVVGCISDERKALLQFKGGLTDPSASFGGTIPPNLGNLTRLSYLDLNNHLLCQTRVASSGFLNGFNSIIPHWLFNLKSLVQPDLSSNHFHGALPDAIANNRMSIIPECVGQLSKLVVLTFGKVSWVKLIWPIPRDLGEVILLLSVLDVSYNSLNGRIPFPRVTHASPTLLSYLVSLSLLGNHVVDSRTGRSGTGGELLSILDRGGHDSNLQHTLSHSIAQTYISNTITSMGYSSGITTSIGEILLLVCGMLLCLSKLCICLGEFKHVGCVEVERKALLEFKDGLVVPSGRLSSWVGEDCCKWAGVICNNETGRVVKLKLRNPYPNSGIDRAEHELDGGINSSLHVLKDLKYLDLSMNFIRGSQIPYFIGSLGNLRYLNLSHASFGGVIPPNLGNLSRLNYLDLSRDFNPFVVGKSSSLHWLSGLVSLKYLSLEGWNLTMAATYWLQTVIRLPHLLELHLSSCGLSDLPLTVPFVNLTSLLVLDLSNNEFNSTIPHWLLNLESLVELDLSSNHFHGALPDVYRNNCSLEILNLAHNKLTGNLPNTLGYIKSLRKLLLSNNLLQGSIPHSIGNSTSLETFLLSGNQMSAIPESLGQLSNLVQLDISHNIWEGVLTEAHLVNLSSLKELSIININNQSPDNISLIFNISSDWLPPFKLGRLSIHSCQLGPKFPTWLKNQNELSRLSLTNAKISDTSPNWFWQLDLEFAYNNISGKVLKFLLLSNNNLSGELPSSLRNCSKLNALDLGDNKLSGELPAWIGRNMSALSILRMRSNLFSGKIPSELCGLSDLHVLDFSNNDLSGHIPHCIGNLSGMKSGAQMNGDIALLNNGNFKIMAKGRTLEYTYFIQYAVDSLDLSNNKLSGEIPEELTSLVNLWSLNMSINHLTGNIPSDIGNMKSLETLDLSRNKLVGQIPPTMSSLTFLNHLNLSYNNLSSKIPTANQFQTLLDPSMYQGNVALCGQPLPTNCSGNEQNSTQGDQEDRCLIVNKSWRDAYFGFVKQVSDASYCFIECLEVDKYWGDL
ncbi:hypothetical protein FNV43_RR14977 [Rhamnella rubrinervis]|uniref:Leucine-rich repeat-containing N-terminal plant-type domain-containing protein n=1 Tax=Rhamnella rubrinervis TaxID=2594499 RepID=A0A8K0MGU3_9ROSA|nr:hypothetical protein FNV43_RR14977 [Rhamnella rubrinervis]